MGKIVAVILMLLALPLILLGMVLGFVWEHLDLGWHVGRASSGWLGDRAAEIRQLLPKEPE